MLEERFSAGGFSARLCRCNTAVVGTGAAGYNAADRLWQLGQRDILIVTENRLAGTSRNTGSDKQTYYKLTLSGPEGDSVREMAETLFSGQCRSRATVTESTSATKQITTRAGVPPA